MFQWTSCAIIADAYTLDTEPFHKVHLKHIYAVATGADDTVDPLVKQRVQVWLSELIFPIAPPESSVPLLYTLASCKMTRWGDPSVIASDERLDMTLVPIIPRNCKVKLTDLVPIAEDDNDDSHEQYRDLRQDIMQAAHSMLKPHPSVARTLTMSSAWPPGTTWNVHVQYFCDTCPNCLPRRTSKINLGRTMVATRRFGGAVMLDRLVLDKALAEIVNAPAVTIFTCPCIGDSLSRDRRLHDCS